jgi:hypothetical protein
MRLSVEQLIHLVGKIVLEILSEKMDDQAKMEDRNTMWVLLEERLTQGEIQELHRLTGYSPLHWIDADEFGPIPVDFDGTPINPDEVPF